MAKATVSTEKVKKLVETIVEVKTITLELTELEAKIIKSMVGRIGGSGKVRDITDGIYSTLYYAGIREPNNGFTKQLYDSDFNFKLFEEQQ